MSLTLQQEKPEYFVFTTGQTTQIRDLVRMAFSEIGVELAFGGSEENEEGFVVASNGKYKVPIGQVVIKIDSRYDRPTEVDLLI